MGLEVVYPLDGSTTASTIDIVAVHGLGGHPKETWTHPKSKAFWLGQFLPNQIPDARILTFDYNATVAFSSSTSTVVDHAKRLLQDVMDKRDQDEEQARHLIFIAHSLGGIVVKQALLSAKIDPLYKAICDATIGIVFFGTPHRGSDKASIKEVLVGIAQTVTHRPPNALIRALKTNSMDLQQLTTSFRHQLEHFEVVSFYEQRRMKFFRDLIVEKNSALLETSNEEQLPVDADHSAMCKFEDDKDDTYEKTWKRLLRMKKKAQQVVEQKAGSATGSAHEYWIVPRSAQPLFTGRKELLQDLERVVRDSPCRIVISGLGGQGKSEVALQLAQRLRHIFWAVLWVDVSTADIAERSFVDAAQMFSSPVTTGKAARLKIANLKVKWLLILDNADSTEVDYLDYFPDSNFGSIVMTTRNKECERYGTTRVVNLAGLDNCDAIELLLKTCRIPSDQYELYQQDACSVVNLLGSHTLALLLAGAYVARGHSTLADYPQAYRTNPQRLMRIRPQQAKSRGQDVYSTFELSTDALRSVQNQKAQDALQLLHLLAVCGPDSLPIRMLCEIAWQSSIQIRKDSDRICDLTPWHVANLPSLIDKADELNIPFRLMEAISLLKEYSLVSTSTGDNNSFVSLHPLVHAWAWDRQDREEQHRSWIQVGCLVALTLCSQDLTPYNKLALQTHIEALTDSPVSTMFGATKSLPAAQILYRCCQYLLEMMAFNKTSVLIRKISEGLHLDRPEIDQAHLEYHELTAWDLHYQGKFEESARLWEQIVKFREESCPGNYEGLLTSQHKLAAELAICGRKEDAIILLDKTVKSSQRLLPEKHPIRLLSQVELARALQKSGQTEKALVLLERLVENQRTLPRDYPQRLSTESLLATVYQSMGRLEEAIALREKLIVIGHKTLTEDNPDLLSWRAQLAECLWQSGQQGRAVEMLRKLQSVANGVVEENHPSRQYFEKELAEWEVTMAKSV